jgi:hypothetical protein
VKVGDLVRHKLHKVVHTPYWNRAYLVRWTDDVAFQVWDDHRFFPLSDYEVVSESR